MSSIFFASFVVMISIKLVSINSYEQLVCITQRILSSDHFSILPLYANFCVLASLTLLLVIFSTRRSELISRYDFIWKLQVWKPKLRAYIICSIYRRWMNSFRWKASMSKTGVCLKTSCHLTLPSTLWKTLRAPQSCIMKLVTMLASCLQLSQILTNFTLNVTGTTRALNASDCWMRSYQISTSFWTGKSSRRLKRLRQSRQPTWWLVVWLERFRVFFKFIDKEHFSGKWKQFPRGGDCSVCKRASREAHSNQWTQFQQFQPENWNQRWSSRRRSHRKW